MGCFLKALPNVKSAYVTCKEFTPNLQIFYTFLIFGFDVQVSGLKLPQWNTFIELDTVNDAKLWIWILNKNASSRIRSARLKSSLSWSGLVWWCVDDALMMHLWCTDDALMMHWWYTDDALMMRWWWADDALMMHECHIWYPWTLSFSKI